MLNERDPEEVGSDPFEHENLIQDAVREATPHQCGKCQKEQGFLQYSQGYPAGYYCEPCWEKSGYDKSDSEPGPDEEGCW